MDEPSSREPRSQRSPQSARSGSSSASSINSHDDHDHTTDHSEAPIFAPTPVRPRLSCRQSSGSLIVDRDSAAVFAMTTMPLEPGDVRAMSPRRSSQDVEALGKETRDELQKHAKALQDSLLTIFHRIEAVKEEHNKLHNNNKFLQKYIGDLMMTSKITSTGSKLKK